jgi:hypothetical protein
MHRVDTRFKRVRIVDARGLSLGQERAQQPTGVIATALLSVAVRMAEVHPPVGYFHQRLDLSWMPGFISESRNFISF